jgi:thiopeptide-type bacteriocin biosynthesis protein
VRTAQTDLEASGFFVLRTPLLPATEWTAWSDGLSAGAAQEAELSAALARDRQLLRARLGEVLMRPEVEEALFLASPSLAESVPLWREEPASERGQKIERALVRYFSRMCMRSTPFALFAGTSLGTVGDRPTALDLKGRSYYRRHARLDMYLLTELTDALAAQPEVMRRQTYRPNTSLFRAGKWVRFVEVQLSGGARAYHLVRVPWTEALGVVLGRAQDGASFEALALALLESDGELTRPEVEDFLAELVQAHVVEGDLSPTVTGPEPLPPLLDALGARGVVPELRTALEAANRSLVEMDEQPLGAVSGYREISQRLAGLPVPAETGRWFQVELFKPGADCRLNGKLLEEVSQTLELLQRIQLTAPDPLRQFKESFAARYDLHEVPLQEALDVDWGVGFGESAQEQAPFLEGLPVPASASRSNPPPELERLLGRKLRGPAPPREWVLSDEDVSSLASTSPAQLPDALCVALALEERGDADFKFLVLECSGPSGVEVFARFCHGHPALQAHVLAQLRKEEALRPESLFVEVAHLPAGRHGNVLLRPLLREYELPFLARSGARPDHQLRLDDIRVCVRDGRVRLRSVALNRELVVRHTNTHAAAQGLGLYRFLVAVAQQDARLQPWTWGPLENRPFLPRVTRGRAILSLAQWRLEKAQLERFIDLPPDTAFRAFQALRAEMDLPRWFALVNDDQVLPVDSENALTVDSFLQQVRAAQSVQLREVFPEPGRSSCRGPEGPFQNELFVPFVRRTPRARPADVHAELPRKPPLGPGGPWLYQKLYCGPLVTNEVLLEVVARVVELGKRRGLIERWFFVRYADPDWHLRFRVRGDPTRLWQEVAPALQREAEDLLADGRVWRAQLDTYDPELERYGGSEGLDLAEQFFAVDSETALEALAACAESEEADLDARLVLRGADLILDGLGYTLPERLPLLERLRRGYLEDCHAGPEYEHQLAVRFRAQRPRLEAMFRPAEADPALAAGQRALERRVHEGHSILARIRECSRDGRLSQTLDSVAASLMHMQANRWLTTAAIAQELVVYDFLGRLYRSRLARGDAEA